MGSLSALPVLDPRQAGEGAAVAPRRGGREGGEGGGVGIADFGQLQAGRADAALGPLRRAVDQQQRGEPVAHRFGDAAVDVGPVAVVGVGGVGRVPAGRCFLGGDARPVEDEADVAGAGVAGAVEGERAVVADPGDPGFEGAGRGGAGQRQEEEGERRQQQRETGFGWRRMHKACVGLNRARGLGPVPRPARAASVPSRQRSQSASGRSPAAARGRGCRRRRRSPGREPARSPRIPPAAAPWRWRRLPYRRRSRRSSRRYRSSRCRLLLRPAAPCRRSGRRRSSCRRLLRLAAVAGAAVVGELGGAVSAAISAAALPAGPFASSFLALPAPSAVPGVTSLRLPPLSPPAPGKLSVYWLAAELAGGT